MAVTRPQTLAYALTDSPVRQLAWNAEWFADYGDGVGAIDRDVILTYVTITHWSEFDRGGHFTAIQAPDLLIKDVRAFFRGLR
jgi:hypothetical protein